MGTFTVVIPGCRFVKLFIGHLIINQMEIHIFLGLRVILIM